MKCEFDGHTGAVCASSGHCEFYFMKFKSILQARDFFANVPRGEYEAWHGRGLKDSQGNIYLRRMSTPGATYIDGDMAQKLNLEKYAHINVENGVRKAPRRRKAPRMLDKWFGGV